MQQLQLTIVFILVSAFPALAQDFRSIRDGIEYAQFTRQLPTSDEKNAAPAASVNALRLDLSKVRLDVVHALDAAIGVEKTSSIARRHGAFAAINAGFFRLDKSIFNGEPAGVLQIDGRLLSESYANRIALLIDNAPIPCSVCETPDKQTRVSFERLKTWGVAIINKRNFDLVGINRERKIDELILYTTEFHRTTLTDAGGLEITVRKGKITRVVDGAGSSEIPADGFVLSASGKKRAEILPLVKVGKKIWVPTNNSAEEITDGGEYKFKYWTRAEDVVGGAPQLVRDGKIEITWEAEKQSKEFVETRHPRTAVAKLKDGKFLMVTVDGRSETSGGMTLPQLAEMLLELGAVEAMNLDGGGSTTMFLNGEVVNQPSDKEGERAVSDAILVFPRR